MWNYIKIENSPFFFPSIGAFTTLLYYFCFCCKVRVLYILGTVASFKITETFNPVCLILEVPKTTC